MSHKPLKVSLIKGKGPAAVCPPIPNTNSPATEPVNTVRAATDPEHYKGLKKLGIESIAILENFMEMDCKLTPTQKFLCASALKYILRVGRKDSVEIDLQKAENYIHRARTGKWIPSELLGK